MSVRFTLFFALVITFFISTISTAMAAQVALAWDHSNPAPDGYRVYQRIEGGSYDYTTPVWPLDGDDPTLTNCTIQNLADDTSYYFFVRAYADGEVNCDSNEVQFVTPPVQATEHTITVAAGTNGTITPGSSTVADGQNQTFAIAADAGYRIQDVLVDGVSVGAVSSHTFYQVAADHSISASFAADTHLISSSFEGSGTISPVGSVSVIHNADQHFTITPDAGSAIFDVLVDGASIGPVQSHSFTGVDSAHSIHAIFEDQTHTILASCGPNGSVSPSGGVTVPNGDTLIISVTPNSGYRITDVIVDGASVGPVASHTFSNVTGDHSLSASFEQDAHTITASAGEGGVILPSGAVSISAGSSQTFQITAGQGYEIEDVTVNGASVGPVSSYTFTLVDGDHAIDAAFSPVNQSPVSNAGPDQAVDEQSLVTLNGLNSFDADDGIATFQWHQISGPFVSLMPGSDGTATFHAPDVDATGTALEFELVVTDYSGEQSSDRCIVNVTWVNIPPVAAAGQDQTMSEGDVVVLNADGSSDDDDGIATYGWRQVSGHQVILSNPDSAYPSFHAPDVGPEGAALAFELTVTDNGGLQDTDSCVVTVTWNNAEPVADAGPDHQVSPGSEVLLDGSASADPDGLALTFQWRQTFGPPVTLSDATAVRPVFTVPVDGFDGQALTFELIVTDSGGLQGVDSCIVSVSMPDPPPDEAPPVLSIHAPANTYQIVYSAKFTLLGTAGDDNGVVQVVWQSNRGGSGVAVGTNQWRIDNVKLRPGDNRITVTAMDSAGNAGSETVVLHYDKKRRK